MTKKNPLLTAVLLAVSIVAGLVAFSYWSERKASLSVKEEKAPVKMEKGGEEQNYPLTGKDETRPDILNLQEGEKLVRGTVVAVDLEKRIITVKTGDEKLLGQTNIPLSRDATVWRQHEDSTLAEVKKGDRVTIVVSAEGMAKKVFIE